MGANYRGPAAPWTLEEAGVRSWADYLSAIELDAGSGYATWDHFFAEKERVETLPRPAAVHSPRESSPFELARSAPPHVEDNDLFVWPHAGRLGRIVIDAGDRGLLVVTADDDRSPNESQRALLPILRAIVETVGIERMLVLLAAAVALSGGDGGLLRGGAT